MHICNHFVNECYNVFYCAVFNFVIIIVVLIFTNSPFIFIFLKFTTASLPAYSDPPLI